MGENFFIFLWHTYLVSITKFSWSAGRLKKQNKAVTKVKIKVPFWSYKSLRITPDSPIARVLVAKCRFIGLEVECHMYLLLPTYFNTVTRHLRSLVVLQRDGLSDNSNGPRPPQLQQVQGRAQRTLVQAGPMVTKVFQAYIIIFNTNDSLGHQ